MTVYLCELVEERPLGARFRGTNEHPAAGRWQVECTIVEYEPEQVMGWIVDDPAHPAATWRFSLESLDGCTRLTRRCRIGPGRSGLSQRSIECPTASTTSSNAASASTPPTCGRTSTDSPSSSSHPDGAVGHGRPASTCHPPESEQRSGATYHRSIPRVTPPTSHPVTAQLKCPIVTIRLADQSVPYRQRGWESVELVGGTEIRRRAKLSAVFDRVVDELPRLGGGHRRRFDVLPA